MGLEPTKMRQDLKKSVSFLLEGEEKIISFGYDFSMWRDFHTQWQNYLVLPIVFSEWTCFQYVVQHHTQLQDNLVLPIAAKG